MKRALKIQPHNTYRIADITKISKINFQELHESRIWQKADNDTVFINQSKDSQSTHNSSSNNDNNNSGRKRGKGNKKRKKKDGKIIIPSIFLLDLVKQPQMSGKESASIGARNVLNVGGPIPPNSTAKTSKTTRTRPPKRRP